MGLSLLDELVVSPQGRGTLELLKSDLGNVYLLKYTDTIELTSSQV